MVDASINIRGLKRYAVEHAEMFLFQKNSFYRKEGCYNRAGPSGLTAGYYLSLMGHDVEIFEQRKYLGGMLGMVYLITDFLETLQKEIDSILSTELKFIKSFCR